MAGTFLPIVPTYGTYFAQINKSAHLVGGVTEIKAVGFGNYKATLLEGVSTCGWGYLRVPI